MNEVEGANASAAEQAKAIIEQTFSELALTVNNDSGKFFPHGIGLIDLEVSVGGKDKPLLHVKCKIDGVQPAESGATLADGDKEWSILQKPRPPAQRIAEAKRLLAEGKVYPLGCSGFICSVLGIAHEQANSLIGDDATAVGSQPPYQGLSPGDIVGWQNDVGSGHVSIYVGESDQVYFIDVREPGAKPRAKNAHYNHELYKSRRF